MSGRNPWNTQLKTLLEQILTPEQYKRGVKANENSDEVVEFAIKLPVSRHWWTHATLPVFAVSNRFIPVFVTELYGEILWPAAWCGSSAVGVVEAVRVLAWLVETRKGAE